MESQCLSLQSAFHRAMIKYVAEFKDDRTKFNRIVSSGVITSLFIGIGFVALFYFASGIFAGIFDMPGLPGLIKIGKHSGLSLLACTKIKLAGAVDQTLTRF